MFEFLFARRVQDIALLSSIIHRAALRPRLGRLRHTQVELFEGRVGALVGSVDGCLFVGQFRLD